MDFNFSDEQKLLREGVERLLANTYDFSKRASYLAEPEGWSRSQWRRFADMGLLGLPFDAAYGGFAGGAAEIQIVMEAFGGSLVVEPYIATVLLCGGLLQAAGSDDQKARFLPKISDGSLTLAFAQAEPNSRYDLAHIETRAERSDCGGWKIDGLKRHVLAGDTADWLIVSARVDGGVDDSQGVALFLVDAAAQGISRRGYRLQDHTRAAEVRLESVRVDADAALGEPGMSFSDIARVVNRAVAAQCCEAVGVMASAHQQTIDYLKVRQQFGRPLGSFQALQHRAAEMYVQLEMARSMSMYGILASGYDDLSESSLAAAATKIQVNQAGRLIGQEAIQMHGGIGMTDELPVGHFYRRLTMLETIFGDTAHHLERFAREGGLISALPAEH